MTWCRAATACCLKPVPRMRQQVWMRLSGLFCILCRADCRAPAPACRCVLLAEALPLSLQHTLIFTPGQAHQAIDNMTTVRLHAVAVLGALKHTKSRPVMRNFMRVI